MDKKEVVLTVAKDLLIEAMRSGKIDLKLNMGSDKGLSDLGDRFKVLVDKVASIYTDLS